MSAAKSMFRRRAGQHEFELGVRRHRVSGLLARRQFGKTTIVSRIALYKMMKEAGHTVIFGSVKLDLGREIVRKEAEALQKAFAQMSQEVADAGSGLLNLADSTTGKSLPVLSADDFAELYEATRLEFRLYHDNSVYSRTKVVALTPEAVGETGDMIIDEPSRVKNFQAVLEAIMPIISSNPTFRAIFATTPPPDDAHPTYALLAPPVSAELPINPAGNWYVSELGVHVLRVTAYDAYADGVPLYDDDTGAPIAPEESRRRASDKDAWDRNYGCQFVLGGTSAVGLLQLDTAQRRGAAAAGLYACRFFAISTDEDFEAALDWLEENLGTGRVGIGADIATTTKQKSNPTAVSVVEEHGVEMIARVILVWKTTDPAVATMRFRRIAEAVAARAEGGPARRMSMDATNERYFCETLRRDLARYVPVELVVMSETIERPTGETMTMKQYLGSLLVGVIDDNHLTLPPDRYVREDFRLVKKEKGDFVCEPDENGRHGDTFDSTKLGKRALMNAGGAISAETLAQMRTGAPGRPVATFTPRRL